VTNQHKLRLETGTDCCWVLAGSNACNYALVNEYLGYLVDRNYSPRTVRAYGYDLLAFCRWLDAEGIALDSVTTDVDLNFMHFCRQVAIKDRPANVVSMSGRRLDSYAATTINHRLAALAGLFTFRSMRDPEVRNPIPSGREARRVSAAERNGLLGHLVRPKRRSALRLRESRRLPTELRRTSLIGFDDSAGGPEFRAVNAATGTPLQPHRMSVPPLEVIAAPRALNPGCVARSRRSAAVRRHYLTGQGPKTRSGSHVTRDGTSAR
jgi:hypothetical protein